MAIETEFQIDKKKLIPKFKERVKQYSDDEEDRFEPKNSKEVAYSKLEILRKIQKIYVWVIENSLINLRQMYNHDEKKFRQIKNALLSFVRNKIRSTSEGGIYLKVGDLIAFNGERDQYEEWIVDNKQNQERIIRNMIDELNLCLQGTTQEDHNKPILNDREFVGSVDISKDETVQYIFDRLKNETDYLEKLEKAIENQDK